MASTKQSTQPNQSRQVARQGQQGERMPAPIEAMRDQINKMAEQFRVALPAHMPVERFMRVVMTAVQREPKLLACDRRSFFNACMQAANDGLLPDSREGALVPFNSEKGGSTGVTWIPMVYGLRKKVRNAGVLSDWNCQVVHEGDEFEYQLGDNPYIHHKPASRGGRDRPVTHAYSIATYPDGTKSREVMNIDQIMDIKKLSKGTNTPWNQPVMFPEMCRKTVARLHSKQLPMSTDLDTILRRDDALYDFEGAREEARLARPPGSVAAALDHFANDVGGETGGETDNGSQGKPPADDARPEGKQADASATQGAATREGELFPGDAPKSHADYRQRVETTIDAVDGPASASMLGKWWASDEQAKLREHCKVPREMFDELDKRVRDTIKQYTT